MSENYGRASLKQRDGKVKPLKLEALKMSDTALTLDKIFEEAGLVAKWEARGEARGDARGEDRKAIDVAKNMIALGYPQEAIVSVTGLDFEKVKELFLDRENQQD